MEPGDTLGTYQVLAKLGEGGMGEVYRCRDTKLNRDVAIKILPDAVAHDADRVARFTREAQTLAALNHPNIAQIYGIVEAPASPDTGAGGGHVHALVMELVEGEDLSAVVARGAIPVTDALLIARQVADALEAAHEQGIVHRDLKPANIKVRPDGTVKVLDFGLAKALDPGPEDPASISNAANSPTLTARGRLRQGSGEPGTELGMIIGTAAYMAPEQARGKSVDKRADIWAFGVVLYEMLTGRRAFDGEDTSDILAAVLRQDIDWAALPAGTPPAVRRLLRRCVEKDSRKRLSAIGDARLEFDEVEPPAAVPTATHAPRQPRLAWAVAILMALAAAAAGAYTLMGRGDQAPPAPIHLALPVDPADVIAGTFAFSPDGTQLAFVGRKDGTTGLYLRSLGTSTAALVPGSEGIRVEGAAFSPDGRWVAFSTGRKLMKAPVDGGRATAIGQTWLDRPAWGPGNTIIFAAIGETGLSQMATSGGTIGPLTRLDPKRGEIDHGSPVVLRSGRTLIYQATTTDDVQPLVIAQSLETGESKPLFRGRWTRGLPSGELLFVRGTTLMKIGFDERTLSPRGEAAAVMERIFTWGEAALVEPSSTGMLAYYQSAEAQQTPQTQSTMAVPNRLVVVSRDGTARPIELPERTFSDPRVSPDGTRLVVHGFETGRDNWVADLRRGTLMRLTFDPGEDETPIWTPDSNWIVYTSTRADVPRAIYRKAADGSGPETLVWKGTGHVHLGGFTPDGKTLVVSRSENDAFDLAAISVDDGKFEPLTSTPFGEFDAALSRDGRWLAYASDESSRPEVFVRSFPSLDGRWQVSTDGGTEPVWARDGRTLYYRGGGKLMAVDISPGAAFTPSAPRVVFDDRFAATQTLSHTCYDTMPDGSLLMVQEAADRIAIKHINVVLNFFGRPSR